MAACRKPSSAESIGPADGIRDGIEMGRQKAIGLEMRGLCDVDPKNGAIDWMEREREKERKWNKNKKGAGHREKP